MQKTLEELLHVPLMHSSLAAIEIGVYLYIKHNTLLYNNTFQKLEHLHEHEHLTHLVALSFASSVTLIIPYGSYLGCYVMSDIHLQQSTYPCNLYCHKTNTMLFPFSFFVCLLGIVGVD